MNSDKLHIFSRDYELGEYRRKEIIHIMSNNVKRFESDLWKIINIYLFLLRYLLVNMNSVLMSMCIITEDNRTVP